MTYRSQAADRPAFAAAAGTPANLSLRGFFRAAALGAAILLGLSLDLDSAEAQTATVSGIVRDEAGAPLASTQVVIQDTGIGAITNVQGRFILSNVTVGARIVEAGRIGYQTAQQPLNVVTGGNDVSVVLRSSPLVMEAIVATGQGGEISRRRLSTNIDVVTAEEIEDSPATRLDQLLQTKLPGAQIRMTSGQAGTTSLIRTRGINSVSTNSTPVIYVDGVRVDNLNTGAALSLGISGSRHQGAASSALADLPLENIERIEHIPGGAATTMYGSDAANGVIQIFTKRGMAGPTRFTAESQIGLDTPLTDFHFFDRTSELLYQRGMSQQYTVGLEGGTSGFTYSVSGNVRAQESHRREGENTALGFRSGFGAGLGSKGRYNASLGYNQSEMPRFRNGNSGGYNSLWFVEGGRSSAFGFNNNIDELDDAEWTRLRDFVHRAEALENYRVQVRRFMTSHGFIYEASDDLTLNATMGLDQRFSNERGITTNEFLIHTRSAPAGTADRGSIENFDRNFLGFTADLSAQHRQELGNLSFISSFGGQLFRNQDEQVAYRVREGERNYEGWANADGGRPLGRELELVELLRFIKHEKIRNTVWITGDVHYAAAHHYSPERGSFTDFDPFWELVAGPMHAGTFGPNALDGTFGPEVRFAAVAPTPNRPPSDGLQFFGTLEVDPATRAMTAGIHDVEGTRLWSMEMPPAEP